MKKLFSKDQTKEKANLPAASGEAVKKKASFWKTKKFKHSGFAVGITVIVIVVVVLFNFLMSALSERYPMSIDMTQDKAFEISQETRDYVAGLDKEVQIRVLASEQNFVGQNDYFAQAAQIIDMYAKISDKITVEYIDLVQNPQLESQYADLEIADYDILITSGEDATTVSPYDLFNTMQTYYGYQIISSKAEQTMTSAIMRVTDENKVKIAVLNGHGEDPLTYFAELMVQNNYEVIEHSVVTEDIPDDVKVAWMAAPTSDYSVEELSRIDDFLERDGTTLIYLGDASQPDIPNLDAFLAEWGIQIDDGLIYETDGNMYFNQNPFFTIVNYASDRFGADLMEQNIAISMPYASPMTQLFDSQGDVQVRELLSFSETTGIMPADADENFTISSDSASGPYPALLYSTKTRSDGSMSHVLAGSSVTGLISTLLESTSVGNGEYFLSVLADLAQREDALNLVDKNISGSELGVNSTQAIFLGAVFVVALPLVVLVTGIAIWLRRRHR